MATNEVRDYSYLYSKTREICRAKSKRMRIFSIPILILLFVFPVVFAAYHGFEAKEFNLIFSLFALLPVAVFLTAFTLYESFNKESSIERCSEILQESDGPIVRFKDRASVDVGASGTRLRLPSLLVAFLIPINFSIASLVLTYTPSSLSTTASPFGEILRLIPEPEVLLALVPPLLFMITFCLLIAITDLFERVSVSTVIQHACIEHEATERRKSGKRVTTMMYENLKRGSN